MGDTSDRVTWRGVVQAIQCRATVWRYKTDNRTHRQLGFNLWLDGDVNGQGGSFVVAISGKQQEKAQFRAGDEASGTAWPVENPKSEVAAYYRAGALRLLRRDETTPLRLPPPFTGVPPRLDEYEARGARMLDAKRWRKSCFPCIWANKSAVEIEYDFGKTRRRRFETFCYSPKSCAFYDMGEPRPVQYCTDDGFPSLDSGSLDDIMTGHRDD